MSPSTRAGSGLPITAVPSPVNYHVSNSTSLRLPLGSVIAPGLQHTVVVFCTHDVLDGVFGTSYQQVIALQVGVSRAVVGHNGVVPERITITAGAAEEVLLCLRKFLAGLRCRGFSMLGIGDEWREKHAPRRNPPVTVVIQFNVFALIRQSGRRSAAAILAAYAFSLQA